MFVDKVTITAKAGDGGDGIVSFRHEKFIDKGGPDGGDGGDGGDVILKASHDQNTLAAFRYKKLIEAESGRTGGKRKKRGKSGKDLVVKVPVGTVITDEEERILADLYEDGQTAVVSTGGKGGFGNAHFVSSRRQIPKIAEKGETGQKKELTLELKMIADVGLVGLPNAGKSTLLSVVSSAKPEIADYPFTTLKPNLGVVDVAGSKSLLMADIPGLIDGASRGKGLGDEFLRHIERTSAVLHLIDAYSNDVKSSYLTIIEELKAYKTDLSKLPQIVVLTKTDGLDDDIVDYQLAQLSEVVPKKTLIMPISAISGKGVKQLLYKTADLVKSSVSGPKRTPKNKKLPIIRLKPSESDWAVSKIANNYVVSGVKIERLAERANISTESGRQRIFDIMGKQGILRELKHQGIEDGDTILFGKDKNLRIKY